jgi:undecaprenyl-diphosphatase
MPVVIAAIILGIVEGITEFLPISSTGHLILVNEFVSFAGDPGIGPNFGILFNVFIQMGAILAVLIYFWKRLIPFGHGIDAKGRVAVGKIWGKAIVAIIPAGVITLGSKALFHLDIEEALMKAPIVALALLVGGVALILIEGRKKEASKNDVADIGWALALGIGLIQCLAMVPGVSRSAATIIGAMLLGCSRVAAAEFSFFLAIPTLAAASFYELYKTGLHVTGTEALALGVGTAVAFAVALAVVSLFMRFIQNRDFKPFGWYRIALGAAVIAYFAAAGRLF